MRIDRGGIRGVGRSHRAVGRALAGRKTFIPRASRSSFLLRLFLQSRSTFCSCHVRLLGSNNGVLRGYTQALAVQQIPGSGSPTGISIMR